MATNFSSPASGGERVVELARSWIGTPYVHQASVRGVGCDCLGLLRGVWRELRARSRKTRRPIAGLGRGDGRGDII